jgi:two-component system response regulator HupR/HoxA
MRSLYSEVSQVAVGDVPVLIVGETGAGKEDVARILHLSSDRRSGPYVGVNCASIPADLLEAELFGVAKGAATGVLERAGRFQEAAGGVILLDEVTEIPKALQAKLLRALQERHASPVGGGQPAAIDARVVAATNRAPESLVEQERLRADLYYRLAGYTLRVPSLRERRADIPPLVEHFLRKTAGETGKAVRGVTARALDMLIRAPWPGNVRQLANEVRRAVYRCPDGLAISSEMLSIEVVAQWHATEVTANGDLDLRSRVADLERQLIRTALERTRWNKAAAARLLGLTRQGLRQKMARLGMEG